MKFSAVQTCACIVWRIGGLAPPPLVYANGLHTSFNFPKFKQLAADAVEILLYLFSRSFSVRSRIRLFLLAVFLSVMI